MPYKHLAVLAVPMATTHQQDTLAGKLREELLVVVVVDCVETDYT